MKKTQSSHKAQFDSEPFNPERTRQQFPILSQQAHGSPLVYLDNAATTQKPESVIEAVNGYYREQNANVHRASHYLSAKSTRAFEMAREQVQQFLNASSSDEIIWTRGATEAINLVANSWGRANLKAGDEVLLTCLEHHANIVPWQLVAEATGAVIKVVDIRPDGELCMDSFTRQLSDKTRIVCVTHASNAIGTITPVAEIIAAAHNLGALVLVDGAQMVAHQTVDVQKLGCDFYVFSGHKVFGPTGIGVLYGRKALLETMPPWQAGGEMIEQVSFSGTRFNTLPFKFEAGTPNVAGVIGMAAALDFLQSLNMPKLAEYELSLRQKAEAGLRDIPGIKLIGQASEKVSVVSFICDTLHNQDIGLLLDQQGIAVRTGHHCTMPLMERLNLSGTVRASFSVYNTEEDVDRFLSAMRLLVTSEYHTDEEFQGLAVQRSGLPEFYQTIKAFNDQPVPSSLIDSHNWQEKYRQIMLLGKRMPSLPDSWKTEDARLHGCESTVWIHHYYDQETMQLYFSADSDARVIRGLIALVLAKINGRQPDDISRFDMDGYFEQLGLLTHLSPSRGNGLRAIVAEILSQAHRYH
ncbi:SufS family cysteine desulfurase [Endozoicomonas gorgoniicola]|uniref:cysteine desulfurase n=1 Tax=Endozoicomonas gorgoniicola TaxID=1234144 RepID=A0ABT3MXY0_9GAMM|nr:SufS family cysteine desulfurase [Endozoicomonas gorgoniicola]MCW7554243.1 SufS family cysteine desulfurase [Endozoicomonas gorgoniicola]